tara:strand:- start:256 stop:633 length:378 start_codon:yes stop_codon:yes gene_type:complete
MGGLGRDARNKLELQDNATVQIGSASAGNLRVGGTVAISNSNPFQGDTLVVGGNLRLTSGQLIFADGSGQASGSSVTTFPTGDYGLLDAANAATDAFGQATAGLTIFDMLTSPSGSEQNEDLGAF